MPTRDSAAAREVVSALAAAGATVATAESLTGGLLGAALTTVPGASAVYRGGVVAYATDLKVLLLGIDPRLIAEQGVVSAACALAMATEVARRLGATYGLSTTGVAGPEPQEGHRPGTVFVALCGPGTLLARELTLEGERDQIRRQTVASALSALSEQVSGARGWVGEECGLG